MTKKKFFVSLLAFCLILPAMFILSACNFGNSSKLTNNSGFVVEGGGFEKDSVLEAFQIDNESEDFYDTLSKIEEQTYDTSKPVYVFEVSVKKDGVKVQPNGKVKVTIPVSGDLTGYDVLHLKDDGKIERLSMTFKNGKATFETGSFSKFVFVKKLPTSGGGSGEEDGTTKFNISFYARRIVPTSFSEGGTVHDVNGEDIAYRTLSLAEGTQYTVNSFCYPNYYFVGWYEATEFEEATEETFLSDETSYTFSVSRNLNICALYANKDDAVKFTLEADVCGFSYRNGTPTLTIVSKDSTNSPDPKAVEVMALLGDGSVRNYGSNQSGSTNFILDEGGLDYSKVGTYKVTYSYRYNSNIKATLNVQVVESENTLSVSTNSDNLKFRYNVGYERRSLEEILPEGRLVTLTAEPKSGYAFTGWYDEDENLISKKLVYCFEMPNSDLTLHGKYEASSVSLTFIVMYDECEVVDDFGNACIWSGSEEIYFKTGENISLTVREKGYYEFLGWYDVSGTNPVLLTANETINLTLNESKKIKAECREKLKLIEIDSETLSNEGFVNGKVGFAVGDPEIDFDSFTVNAKGVTGSYGTLSPDDYMVDDTSVDFGTAGTYIVTFTYKHNTEIKAEVEIVVVDPQNAQFEFVSGSSYLDHEYNGKATFISLRDVKVDGIALYDFKSTSKIWEKISYKWIDKATNTEAETEGVDITINGNIVKNYGPEGDKRTIGNEFGGPVKAGSYRFEFIYNGNIVFTQDSTILTQVYTKISSDEEFKTNEGSTWVNFELYYYTIIGYADGKYFVMQMPSIGSENCEAEAREISVDANVNAVIGGGNDFAFVYARYFANDTTLKRMEFLTGYYGSYVSHSSNSTVDGTMFGSPYIYRTGYTSISDGKVCREYGNKATYGMSTEFGANGEAKIYSRSGDENGRLRLVKDGDKYVFTSVPADTDTRESFDVFIYRTTIESEDQDTSKK